MWRGASRGIAFKDEVHESSGHLGLEMVAVRKKRRPRWKHRRSKLCFPFKMTVMKRINLVRRFVVRGEEAEGWFR